MSVGHPLRVLAPALLALGVALPTSIAAATPDQTLLVSRGYDGRPGTGGWSWTPTISADGQRVVFSSAADNLWESGPPGELELYLRDFAGPGLLPVSRADGVGGALADNGELWQAGSITASGRYVDFFAYPFGTGRNVGGPGLVLYRRDLTENRTTIVAADDHGQPVDLWPTHHLVPGPVGDRYLLFQTDQPVIDAVGAVGGGLYLRDLEVGRSVLVSRATGPDGAPQDNALGSASPGGRYVTFASGSGALAAGPEASNPAGGGFLYLRDVRLGQTILVSRADGRNGQPIATRTLDGGQIRGDGCQVAFTATGTDVAEGSPANGSLEVYLRDVCRGTTTLVSRGDGDGPAAATAAPTGWLPPYDIRSQAMSADGRYILFATTASNLSDGGPPGQAQLYLRDMIGKRTILVSRADGPDGAPGGAPGGNDYMDATMTPDARYVAFASPNSVLTPHDATGFAQTYRRELGSVPSSPTPIQTCGAIDDPGIGGTPAPPCPIPSDDDNNGGTPGSGLPKAPKPAAVTVPGATLITSGDPTSDAPAIATAPTLVRAPTLSAVTVTSASVRAWLDLPATVHIAIARQTGRRWQTLRTLKITAAKAGRISVKLPKLTRAHYRLTIRALGPSGTTSPPIVRTIDLRLQRTKKP